MNYHYLIIGGGMAADRAVHGIRSVDATSSIGIISKEPYPCYERPPLSKGLWMGREESSIWLQTEKENVTFHLQESALEVDAENHCVKTDRAEYHYDKLLIATGVSAKSIGDESLTLHTLQDYHRLREEYANGDSFLVVGGGYIGTEMAAALAMNGKKVTLVFPEEALYAKKVPREFALFLNAYFTEQGVRLKPGQRVDSVKKRGNLHEVTFSTGESALFDAVIAGVGCSPNLDFLKGIEIDNGIVVDETLQSSIDDIYAAGDVANIHYPLIGRRLRMEHENTAQSTGFAAGRNMAGANEPFTEQPDFYSEIFELGYEAVGLLGTSFEMVERWEDQFRKGTIYYCEEGKVRGAMLWGIWNETDRIRELIKEGAPPPIPVM